MERDRASRTSIPSTSAGADDGKPTEAADPPGTDRRPKARAGRRRKAAGAGMAGGTRTCGAEASEGRVTAARRSRSLDRPVDVGEQMVVLGGDLVVHDLDDVAHRDDADELHPR